MSKFNFNIDIENNNERQNSLSKSKYNSISQKTLYEAYNYAVDLGLPSGTLWCKYNLNVNPDNLITPKDWYGEFYAWGEITSKNDYNWSTYKYGTTGSFTKYCTLNGKNYWGGKGMPDRKTTLDSKDDIATVTLGDNFHIPSKNDFEELSRCTNSYWEANYMNVNNLYGRVFKSIINDNEIFLPAGGSYFEKTYAWEMHTGTYWTNSVALNTCYSAYSFSFSISSDGEIGRDNRCRGLLIRPVMINK